MRDRIELVENRPMDDHDRRTEDDPEPADTDRDNGERSDQVESPCSRTRPPTPNGGRDEIRDRQEREVDHAGHGEHGDDGGQGGNGADDAQGGGGRDHGDGGHDHGGGMHAGHETMFRRRFFVSTLLDSRPSTARRSRRGSASRCRRSPVASGSPPSSR